MRNPWLIAAHALVLALALGIGASPAEAQLGQALGRPASAPPGVASELGAPGEAGALPGPAATSSARPEAAAARGAPGITFDLSVGSSLPLGVGVEGQLTAPFGLFARASVAHVPSAYLDGIATALGDAEVFRPRVRPIVDDLIGNGAWAIRLGAGYASPEGFEAEVGYTALTSGTSLRPSSVESALNEPIPWPSGMQSIPLSMTLHMLHARVGWRFLVEDAVTIRLTLGWSHTVAADAHLDVPPEMRERADDPATRLETGLAEGAREYAFTPELALSVGYRF